VPLDTATLRAVAAGQEGAAAEEARIEPAVAYTLSEFLSLEIPPPEPLLEPWLFRQDLGMVYAGTGVGKSHLALGVAFAVAAGGEFLGWRAPRPRGVLLVDGENAGTELQRRLGGIGKAAGTAGNGALQRLRIVAAMQQSEPLRALDSIEGQRQIEPHLRGVELVILDNLSSLFRAGENDAAEWQSAVDWLLTLRRRGLAVLFFHHAGKGGGQRGTSRRTDVLNVVLRLSRPNDYRAEDGARFVVEFEKSRTVVGEAVEPIEAALVTDPDGRPVWTVDRAAGYQRARALELLNLGATVTDVREEVGASRASIYRWIEGALSAGELERDPRPRKAKSRRDDSPRLSQSHPLIEG